MFGILGLALIVVVVLLLYGGSRLPGVGRGLGKAIQEFKRAYNESGEDTPRGGKDGKDKP